MKKSIVYNILIATLCVVIIAASVVTTVIIVKKELDSIQSENLCIQEWMRLGVERKDVYRNNGDCFFSKELNFPGFNKENLEVIHVPSRN
jgi:hypothetical protein